MNKRNDRLLCRRLLVDFLMLISRRCLYFWLNLVHIDEDLVAEITKRCLLVVGVVVVDAIIIIGTEFCLCDDQQAITAESDLQPALGDAHEIRPNLCGIAQPLLAAGAQQPRVAGRTVQRTAGDRLEELRNFGAGQLVVVG